jgi:ATP-dependent DNA helicase RecG
MLSVPELADRLFDLEAHHVERTRTGQDSSKIGQAICAFANDLAGRGDTGVLFVGALDDGSCAGLEITDQLLLQLSDYARNGRIVPLPLMTVRAETVAGCRLAVIEVRPSDNPPVKFEGRVCVRRGPQKAFATPEEERRLTERRVWGNLPFDQQPLPGTSMGDLDLLRFRLEYLPAEVAPDVLAENGRSEDQQLRAMRLLSPDGRATAAGILLIGKDPRAWLPGAYVQFVRYPGIRIGDTISDEKEVSGTLSEQFRYLDEILSANIEVAGDLSGVRQMSAPSYPLLALQEIIRNAVIHRNYDGTSTPVRLTWYEDRVEVGSPGGPYGQVTQAAFGQEGVTDYRNPALAAAAKAMQFAQRFGSGIPRARQAMAANGNPPIEFRTAENFVHVTLRRRL